jgi:hypothetical protein
MAAYRLSSSPKIKIMRLAQKVMASVFWDSQGMILIDFLEAGATVNSDTYIATPRRLKHTIRKKRPRKDIHSIQLHHDNACPHVICLKSGNCQTGQSCLIHYTAQIWHRQTSTCSGPMKDSICGRRFGSLEEVKSALKLWAWECSQKFFKNSFEAWVHWWHKCVEHDGDYVEG